MERGVLGQFGIKGEPPAALEVKGICENEAGERVNIFCGKKFWDFALCIFRGPVIDCLQSTRLIGKVNFTQLSLNCSSIA